MGVWSKTKEFAKVVGKGAEDAAKKIGKGAGELAKKAGEKTSTVAEMGRDWISERSGVAESLIDKFNDWRTTRKAEKEKRLLESKGADYSEFIKKTDDIEEIVKQINKELDILKVSIEDAKEESESFKLIVSNEIKNLYEEINAVYERINKEKGAQKKKFVIQTVILSIGIVAAIALSVVAIIL
ncbi:MAG: hypothetical protein IKB50_00925 [Clostridia bacterium]|nr:hypothetical protein [Clostridia bacterium]